MPTDATEIEVEVVEVDGIAPAATREHAGTREAAGRDWRDWQQWRGKAARLDSRWWPLWVLLGIVALVLALTLGLVIGVIFLIAKLCAGILRALLR
jgi:hypothetical protein